MQVKEISNTEDSFGSTALQLEISGKNVCFQTMNAIRKASINQIPIYAFHPDKIKITRNSSVYDNSYMSNHLSQLPITKFNHPIKLLPSKYFENVNFAEPKIERHLEDIYQINYSVKVKNEGPEPLLNVSTNDLVISITNTTGEKDKLTSDEPILPKEKYSETYPILLIQLRVGEEFECSMKGVVAVGELDGIFNASNTYYKEITPDKFILTVESSGQLSEYEILIRACEIIIEKLNLIKDNLKSNQLNMVQTENNSLILEILKEDHTCGGPLNWVLQNMKEVKFSGINKPDFMQKIINIVLQTDEKTKPIECLEKAIGETVKIYEEYKNEFTRLYKGTTKNTIKGKKK
jgi:DNA-directed RNA polymerase subunit L